MTGGDADGPTASTPEEALGGASARARAGSRVRTVFFGSGAFAVPILDAALAAPEVSVVAVVSTPDRPSGRRAEPTPTPVAAAARERGLTLLQPASLRDPASVAALRACDAPLGILADYGRIVPPDVLALFPRGIVNVHPSLLPRHRGATPIPAAILAGDAELGVGLIELVDRLDAGPVIATRRWSARGDETAPDLEEAAAEAGAALLGESLGPWLAGRRPAVAQEEAAATLTRPLRREDGRLDPGRAAAELERAVRAYAGWPGTFLEAGGTRIAVHAAHVDVPADGTPGTLVAHGDGLALRTADGRLVLDRVQPAGGRAMTGAELRRGRPQLVGAVVEA